MPWRGQPSPATGVRGVPEGTAAPDRLARLLHVLPAAARAEGALLSDLARELGTTPSRVAEDLEEVTTREAYHPGGWPDDMLILLEADRVRVLHAAIDRPIRLSSLETFCLSLALRGAVAEARLPEGDARVALLRRAERHLAQHPEGTSGRGARKRDEDAPAEPSIAVDEAEGGDPEGVRRTLLEASRQRRPCIIHYVKAGAHDGELRRIQPWAIVAAEGHWYALGHCERAEGTRAFRLDRILAADTADGTFEVPEDFDPHDHLEGRRMYRSGTATQLRVRYGPRIARWVRERAERDGDDWDAEADGGVLVTHSLADPGWALGHALQYGPDAEIVEPEALRARCRAVLEGLGGS